MFRAVQQFAEGGLKDKLSSQSETRRRKGHLAGAGNQVALRTGFRRTVLPQSQFDSLETIGAEVR